MMLSFKSKEKEALVRCAERITQHHLPMKLVEAEYTFDGSRLTFYFAAEQRVDFRALVRDLASAFHTRIELRIANRGYLATCGMPSAKKLPHVEPLRVTAEGDGVEVVAPAEAIVEIGHLDGWGAGLYGGPSIFMPWTRGNAHERYLTIVAKGKGTLSVKVGSCRVGYRTVEVAVG